MIEVFKEFVVDESCVEEKFESRNSARSRDLYTRLASRRDNSVIDVPEFE